jgi:tetratricopeptide (TPR) repeat protein
VARILWIVALVFCAAVDARAENSVAKVFSLQGSAQVARGAEVIPLIEGVQIQAGDEVRVGDPGRVALELTDGSYVRLPSGAKMRFPAASDSVDLIEGSMHFFSHSEQHPTVVTEHVTAAIRGTEFTVKTDAKESTINILSGSVDGSSKYGRVSLGAGEGARFERGKAPETFKLMQSDRSVQWSLFVPFIGGDELLGSSASSQKAMELARAGKGSEALRTLAVEKDPCAPENVLRGRLLISGGDPDAGAKILERCVVSKQHTKTHALAESSLAMLRLTQGDRVAAENLSGQALEHDPSSTNARIVRSFVLQDKGDLDGALAVVKSDGNSGDSELRAREAEVLFMFGYVPEAREILEGMSGRSWYAETVYGFVLMGDRSFDEARSAFESASAAQPSAGLPRVGLGIVSFNQGDLTVAREQFEKAAVLEPTRSIYRSYLGKDYFEDDNYNPAYPEYERAIELDKNDPTPHLYRSLMRLADNNLVGALEDLDAVRELAGTRDVYRSSFLLDEDSAVQAASIGRVYDQIGFNERGKIEAITAIMDDYENAAAHRLLAQTQEDIYAADTISSELRMANLFAPLSINVVDSIGTTVSLNEYTQLLEKDGWRSGVRTYYDTVGETINAGVISAHKEGNYVLGLSADGTAQEGIGDDPRTAAGTFAISAQAQPDYGNRLLFEARGTSTSGTDTEESVDRLIGYVSGAWLHRFTPEKTLLVNSTYNRNRAKRSLSYTPSLTYSAIPIELTEIINGEQFTTEIDVPADQRDNAYETIVVNEVQGISDDGPVQSIFTYRNSYAREDYYDTTTAYVPLISGEEYPVPLSSSAPYSLNGNSFSYLGDWEVVDGLHVHFGGEYETIEFAQDPRVTPFLTQTEFHRELWSPKAGIVYSPTESVILRTGYGEGLGKGVYADLTSIEPTLIGGIVQRYNDQPGTKNETFGVGGDFRPTKTTYMGAEWTKRWLSTLYNAPEYSITVDYDTSTISSGNILSSDIDQSRYQDFINAYLYQVLSDKWVAGLDYRYVHDDTPDIANLINDQRGKAFTRYFFENGLFLQGSSLYRWQDAQFPEESGIASGTDHVWFFGAGVGYRLPTRHGFLLCDVQNIFNQDVNMQQTDYFNEPIFSDPRVQLVANLNW